MHRELATVRGIVDLSPQEGLDKAHNFLRSHGYTVVDRTDTALTAQRQRPSDPSGGSTLSLTVVATPQPGGGVRITIGGDDREGMQERQAQWLDWSERLPRKEPVRPQDPGTRPDGAERVLAEAKGVDGQVELLADRIRIRRKGLLAKGKGGDREIPLGQLDSMEFKSGFTGGHIQFVPVGHEVQKGWRRNTEYEVQFNSQQASAFEALRREVERRAEDAPMPRQATMAPSASETRRDELRPAVPEAAAEEPLAKVSGGTKDLLVFGDRLELHRPLSLPPEMETMSLAHVEAVELGKGPDRTNYATVSIRVADGRVLAIGYLAGDEAKRVKEIVERKAAEARRVGVESPEPNLRPAPETATVGEPSPHEESNAQEEPSPQPTHERPSVSAGDIPELIHKLAELRDAGIINNEEFEAKKRDLLDRM